LFLTLMSRFLLDWMQQASGHAHHFIFSPSFAALLKRETNRRDGEKEREREPTTGT
jgi:hypothetical protein